MIFIFLLHCTVYADNGNAPKISAAAAVVVDMETGRVLYAKNHHTKRPMASTTKIMTAILVLEHGNLDDEVKISRRAAQIGGSGIGIREGETHTVRELLYGLLIRSGNDAAIALAEHIGGSVDNFVDMMNRKAWLIGARNTRFKNPHGLDAEGHYTTAYDLAVMTCYALKIPLFSEIVSTRQISIGKWHWQNTNEMLELYPGADGVKTGYTGKAGRCLVTSATRNGRRLVTVVLFCQTRYQRADNSKRILDYAFADYKAHTLVTEGEYVKNIPVEKGKKKSVEVRVAGTVEMMLTEAEFQRIKTVVDLPQSIEAPVNGGTDVGTVSFLLDGEVVGQAKIKAWETVQRKNIYDYLRDLINSWLGIFENSVVTGNGR